MDVVQLKKIAVDEMINGQYADAAKHFDMVVIEDPTDIEAPFYRAYCNCYGIKIGDMSNAAIKFTNAFTKYVNDLKNISDESEKKEKADTAVNMLSILVAHYQYNANRNAFTPTISYNLSSAAKNMNTNCITAVKNAGLPVSEEVFKVNETKKKSNNTMRNLAIFTIVCGIILFIIWEIRIWMI